MTKTQENIRKPKHPFRTKSLFRLSFINENRFNEVWTIKFTRTEIVMAVLLLTAAIGCMVAVIIVVSPIRTLLPGYLKETQRQDNIANSMRIDSMVTKMSISEAYLNNLSDILRETANSDTAVYAAPASGTQLPPDSLTGASEKEKQFVRQFEEEERFNLTVLSPMAAEGISFFPPVSEAVEIDNTDALNNAVTLAAPPESTVCSVYDGTIVASYPVKGNGNTIIIQHPNGFMSKYSGIATPFTEVGDKVGKGSVIGVTAPASAKRQASVIFELWNKGAALNPRDYIPF